MNGDGTKTRGLVHSVLRVYAELAAASVLERRQREVTRIARTARGCTDTIRHVGLLTTWGSFGLAFLLAVGG
jgi:hypothetical protein